MTYTKGKPHFQKRYARPFDAAVRAAGRSAIYKKALTVKPTATLADIAAALEEEKVAFAEYVEILRAGCPDELEELELRRKAMVWLNHHELEPGQFYRRSGERVPSEAADALTDSFSDLYEYEYFQDPHKAMMMEPHKPPERTLMVAVQEMAFQMLTEDPPNKRQDTLTFSDAWVLSMGEKDINPSERRKQRALKKEQDRWQSFIKLCGNRVVTQENVSDALRKYHQHLKARGNLKPESRRRYITPIKSALNLLVEEHGLAITVRAPRVLRKNEDAVVGQRYTFSLEEQIAVLQHFSDQSSEFYAPWKELYVTLMMQTAAIASELQRMPLERLNFEGIPTIYFDDDLKDGARRRVVPLVARVERIKELASQLNDGSGLLLGRDVSEWDESRISRAISAPIQNTSMRKRSPIAFDIHSNTRLIWRRYPLMFKLSSADGRIKTSTRIRPATHNEAMNTKNDWPY